MIQKSLTWYRVPKHSPHSLPTDMGLCMHPHRYGPVYASPQIWTCLCLPTDMGLSMPLNRYGPVYASPQILVCVCLPMTRPTFIFWGKSHNFVKFRMMNFGELPLNASEPFCANGTISNDLTISRQTWPTNKKYLGEQISCGDHSTHNTSAPSSLS